jgi:hypothetical protein
MAGQAIVTAVNYLVREPIEKRSARLLMARLVQILSERSKGRSDAVLARLLELVRPAVPLPPSALMDEPAVAAAVENLGRRGWDILPFRLPQGTIDALHRFTFSHPAYAHHPGERIAILAGAPPRDCPRYIWPMRDLIRLPELQALVADTALHAVAQRYLGGRPLLTSISLWLDAVCAQTYDAHVYHYDIDGPKFLKFFIYLTDVDATSGAHAFIEGSHGHRKPPGLTRAQRYQRDLLLARYGAERELVFEGPAGTILAEDTAGFHKGTTPTARFRLLLQLEYGLLDIPHEEEFFAPIAKAKIDGLRLPVKKIIGKFFE